MWKPVFHSLRQDRSTGSVRATSAASRSCGAQVYRWSDLDFEANARDGVASGLAHPLRRPGAVVRQGRNVHRCERPARRIRRLPDGPFLPPMAMNCVERHVRDRIAGVQRRTGHDHRPRGGADRAAQRSRRVSLLRSVPPRLRDPFVIQRAERHASRRRSHGPLHAPAQQHRQSLDGRSELRPRVRRARHRQPDRQTRVFSARRFSARRRLKRAHPAQFAKPAVPNGLANSSDQVGRNVMDHIKWGGADSDFDGWTDKQVMGNRPNGIYVRGSRTSRPGTKASSAATAIRAAPLGRDGKGDRARASACRSSGA